MLFVIRLALPLEAAGKLNYALCTAGRKGSTDTSEVGAVDVQVAKLSCKEVGPVQNVERLETKLESGPLSDPDVLDKRGIPVHVERSIEERALQISRLAWWNVEEHLTWECRLTKPTCTASSRSAGQE